MPKGLDGVDTSLRRGRSPDARSRLVSAMEARPYIEADLDLIADNPHNPPKRIDLDQLGVPRSFDSDDPEQGPRALVASIVEVGVLSPLLLVTKAAWLAEFPGDAAALGQASWVVVDGNRRKAAAVAASKWARARIARGEAAVVRDHVPGVVRDDLAPQADEVMLHENSNRLDFTAVDEAVVFQRLVDGGMTQREIAHHIGVSQSFVAKRLSLLKLPQRALDLVDIGEVSPAKAFEWAAAPIAVLDEFERVLQSDNQPSSAFAQATSNIRRALAQARAQAEADRRGVPFVEDPDKTLGFSARLYSEKDVAAAAANGTLAVAAGWAGGAEDITEGAAPNFFTTEKPKRQTRSEAEQAETKAHRAAAARRLEFVTAAAAKKPTAGQLRDALATAVVTNVNLNGDKTNKWAMKFAKAAGVGPNADAQWDWRRQVYDDPNIDQLAWIIMLAAYEATARWANWTEPAVRAYYALLQTLGYDASTWELDRINPKGPRHE